MGQVLDKAQYVFMSCCKVKHLKTLSARVRGIEPWKDSKWEQNQVGLSVECLLDSNCSDGYLKSTGKVSGTGFFLKNYLLLLV